MIKGANENNLAVQHKYCPTGNAAWCKYQKNIEEGTNIYQYISKMLTQCVQKRTEASF